MNVLRILMALVMMCGTLVSSAQLHNVEEIAIEYMQSTAMDEGFEPTDFQDYQIIHKFESANNGVTHLYIVQQYQGVEVEHAIFNVNILSDGTVFHHGNKGVKQIASKIAKSNPTVGCHEAFGKCLTDLGITTTASKVRSEKNNEIRFVKPDGLFDDVLVRKVYALQPNGQYRMVWGMEVVSNSTGEALHYQIDVATGQILKKENIAIKCQFDHKEHDNQCRPVSKTVQANPKEPKRIEQEDELEINQMIMDGSQYNVFPLPGESPNHITRSAITNPADAIASPFGWHDTDGVEGAEFTITRGNNVRAVAEHDGDNVGDDNEPDGGASLIFDFPIDLTGEPKTYTDASIANLFYVNNVIHDVAYRYGFDEAAGNFQETNYTGQGAGGDGVTAFGQSRIDEDPSGDTRNNATFQTGAEGFNSTMNMFVWERGVSGSDLLEILEPAALAGTTFRGHPAAFGPELSAGGTIGLVVEAIDLLACDPLSNPSDMAGKIALIDRGICNFDLKVQNAKDAGAIAVVVCNFEESSSTMGGNVDSGIPSVMIGSQDCAVLKASISEGLRIRLKEPTATGPDQVDGTLDNGIVAHEYAHGISTRLVGGAQRRCLSSDQQMGEGWSDFFTLILSVEAGDTGATPRGIGTFVQRDDTDGLGIRRFPYSTDMSINPLTLGDIVLTGSSPHALGSVWCSMIWDLYWALAERDGFDADVYDGSGGNNRAIQLVMDGMKMMDCSPSFIDARDAILAADMANSGGFNQQLIWEVFARRGLGASAVTGNGQDRTSAVEAFDVPGQYDPGLKLEKSMTQLINPGDDITVTLKVTNDNAVVETNLVLTDLIPSGSSYVNNSASQAVQIVGDELRFNLGSIIAGGSMTINYKLSSGGADFSEFIWYDGFEADKGRWIEEVQDGKEGWGQSGARKFNEDFSYFIKNDTVVTDRALRVASPINLSGSIFPVLRFYHYMKSERGYDPGIVQLSRNGGASWEDAGPLMFKNGYSGKIPYSPFAIANQRGYYGDSGEFVDTYVDLRDYIGDDLLFRFRYGSDDENQDEGWYVDEVSVFDMNNFQSQACVSSTETTTEVCAEAASFGSIVNYDLALDVDKPNLSAISQVDLYPNPAEALINITITGKQITRRVDYKVFNVSGKYMSSGQLIPSNGNVNHPIDVSSLPVGMYFVNFIVGDQQVSKRFIKQ